MLRRRKVCGKFSFSVNYLNFILPFSETQMDVDSGIEAMENEDGENSNAISVRNEFRHTFRLLLTDSFFCYRRPV